MRLKSSALVIFFLCMSTTNAQEKINNKYYGHLRYNHVSPYIQLAGIYPMNENDALSTSHYIFKYNKNKELVEIINNHYFTEKIHPLASIGAYKIRISHEEDKEIRTFFDINGKRISNDRKVYKEVFYKDKKGSYSKLEFFDLNDKPMESNWGISEYYWYKNKKMIIEKRYNLNKIPKNISNYFEFGITGIVLNHDGNPKATYNLNQDLKITNNSVGIASYQDTYDKKANHIKYSYHDDNNNLVMSQSGFSVGTKEYDTEGNHIKETHFDHNMKFIRDREIINNQHISLSKIASQKDSLEIKRISLGYLIALQELKPELMNEVMNDSLNKVTVGYSRKYNKEISTSIAKEEMIQNANSWNKSNTKFPIKPKNDVRILDIYDRIATVKLFSDNWVEYLHLIKIDNKWSIINLLWQHKNVKQYPY